MSSDPIWEQSHDETESIANSFETGTANDPPVGAATTTTVSIDGTTVTLGAGQTLLDGIERTDPVDELAALCTYEENEQIGPRGTCRTCMVERVDGSLIPACSTRPTDGMSITTDSSRAREARSVNLDLQLSDHNLLCTTCGKNGRCELQDASIDSGVTTPRFGVFHDREAYEPIDDSSPFIQIDRNKCILCNRCVEACNDVQVEGVLRMVNSAGDTRIGFQNGAESMAESTCVSCGHCVTVCPTGSLLEQGLVDASTIPLPGFTHKNAVGKRIAAPDDPHPRQLTPMKGTDTADTEADK